ncbi:MAG: hypothetical protein HOW97_05415 [Catenulispora sp.]|nr:hypothetical protein [Catenulispora sp.]
MKRTLTLATGLAVGYVAGAHAGRERYEQIKHKAQEIGQQPKVADVRENLREHATAATKTVTGKVTDIASGLADKLHGSDDKQDASATVSTSTTPASSTAPTGYAAQPLDAAPGGGHAL